MNKVENATLVGAFVPLKNQYCFCIPIFERDSSYYTQVLNENLCVNEFNSYDVDTSVINKKGIEETKVKYFRVRSEGVFCFYFINKNKIFFGTKDILIKKLKSELNSIKSPFIKYGIAEFIDDNNLKLESHKKCELELLRTALISLPDIFLNENVRSNYIGKIFKRYLNDEKNSQAVLSINEIINEIETRILDIDLYEERKEIFNIFKGVLVKHSECFYDQCKHILEEIEYKIRMKNKMDSELKIIFGKDDVDVKLFFYKILYTGNNLSEDEKICQQI